MANEGVRGFYKLTQEIKTALLEDVNVNTVTTGDITDVNLNKQDIFPLSHIIVNNVVVNEQTLDFNISILSCDIVNQSKLETVGIFRLIMKEGSDNFRESAIIDIIKQIQISNKKIIIYEPLIKKDNFENIKIINEISEFKLQSDLIIANRSTSELNDVREKVYTRDLFNEN